ncbi:elongin-A-like [Chroicocephalus ridibundus]|uniref:elongin-A-like n=1 Tax=Chroicocephalus ridibundus TaxID=1192867 RepID=UPI002FDC92C4
MDKLHSIFEVGMINFSDEGNKGEGSANTFKTSVLTLPGVSPCFGRKSVGFSSSSEEDDDEDNCEPPTMSFEEYLTYDQPQKKKQAVKPSVSPGQKDHWHSTCLPCQDGLDSACLSAKSPSLKRTNEKRAEKEPPEAPEPKRILLDVDIKLPDIPLPPIQASCSPPPPVESAPRSQRKRKAPALTPEESEEGLSCYRQNSKTLVRPGPKTAPVPRTVPPPQQSTRLLTNSIDSICEVSGVPFSELEPVLERCTPEQLHRIEEPPLALAVVEGEGGDGLRGDPRLHLHLFQALIESTDRLWHIHCLRDFKNEKPEAFESWREMYLRLHEAREQRLLMLSRKIGSAHSNKGQAAKTVFLASPPKAPWDVRRRQKKFGTGGPLVPEKTKIKAVLCAASKSHARGSEEKFYDGPSTSSAHSVPPSATTFSSCDPRKPPVKSKYKPQNIPSAPRAPPLQTPEAAVSVAKGSSKSLHKKKHRQTCDSAACSVPTVSASQAAKTVFLASPPKAPQNKERRQERSGTGRALLPEKTNKSHAPGSGGESHDGPSTSTPHSVPSLGRTMFSSWFPEPKKPPAKKIAPMMAKAVKDFKTRFSRREDTNSAAGLKEETGPMKEIAVGKTVTGSRKLELVADFARKFLAGRKKLGLVSPERDR